MWSNDYQRTVDSARQVSSWPFCVDADNFRLFASGYIGTNASTLGNIYAINASDPSAVADSLATSDSCPTYDDQSGSAQTKVWDSIYLPPIVERLRPFVTGDLDLNTTDLSVFPYLCGFESQITRRQSPFCGVFTPEEILQYEYRQDLRYWYGTGLGAFNNGSVQLPVVQGIVDLLADGPNATIIEPDGSEGVVGPLAVAFTHDNQINQMLAKLGIFDEQPPLAPDAMNSSRVRIA